MNEGIQLGVRQTSLFSLESFILSEMIFFVKIANLSDYSTLNFKFSFCTHSYTEFSNSLIASFPIVFWLFLFVVVTAQNYTTI